MHEDSVPPHWHWPLGPVHVDGWGLFPAGFVEVVVVVHPGLPAVQVLPLPPWLVVVVVSNPFFCPAASAAFWANANEAASRRAEISFVMGFLPLLIDQFTGLGNERAEPPHLGLYTKDSLQAVLLAVF
jgi:hypothetical protein